MACFDPMPATLLKTLVDMGERYESLIREYQEPGGPERLRHRAAEFVQNIITSQQEGEPRGQAPVP